VCFLALGFFAGLFLLVGNFFCSSLFVLELFGEKLLLFVFLAASLFVLLLFGLLLFDCAFFTLFFFDWRLLALLLLDHLLLLSAHCFSHTWAKLLLRDREPLECLCFQGLDELWALARFGRFLVALSLENADQDCLADYRLRPHSHHSLGELHQLVFIVDHGTSALALEFKRKFFSLQVLFHPCFLNLLACDFFLA